MLTKCFLILTLVFMVSNISYADDTKPQVETPLGKIRGYLKTSHGGRKFAAFDGIPYAKPPIDERRFQEPEQVEPWHGIWDATYRTKCPQTLMLNPKIIEGDEDCLYLNVYVPREKPNATEKLDVIAHIHGGAYVYGSAYTYAHPDHLMDKDIIYVTLNYRLGILGFLSTEDDVVSGNNGLKDQVMALKWIRDNIDSFGGNPDSVTLTGLSAGGSSVHLHYFSPLSRGLFHKGFSQSGLALNPFSIQEEPLSKTKFLAHSVGCPTSQNQIMIKCLKQRPYQQLLSKMALFFKFMFVPAIPFGPVIEKGSRHFLNVDPYYLLTQGKVYDVPWIASNTAHEGLFPVAYFKDDLKTINENWSDLAPYLIDYNYTLPQTSWNTVAEKIRDVYLGKHEEINKNNLLKFVQIFSDRFFLVDAETAVRLQAQVTESAVYYYYFGYPGDDKNDKTVAHGEDAKYFFGNRVPDTGDLSSNELKMKDILMNMLVSFAKTGKPLIEGVTWEPTRYDELTYLNITGFELKNIKLQKVKQMAPKHFWKSLGFSEGENLF